MNNALGQVDPEGDSDLPTLGPTVTAGPVNVSVFRGVPLVGVTEFVRHLSGRRLAGFFLEALTEADCVIEDLKGGTNGAG